MRCPKLCHLFLEELCKYFKTHENAKRTSAPRQRPRNNTNHTGLALCSRYHPGHRRPPRTTSGGEDHQGSENPHRKLRTHRANHRLSQDRIRQRTVEQVVNVHVQQIENTVEVKKQHKIIKTKVQSKKPRADEDQTSNQIIKEKSRSRDQANRDSPDSVHPTRSWRCQPISLHSNCAECREMHQVQLLDRAEDVPVVTQRQVPAIQEVQKTDTAP